MAVALAQEKLPAPDPTRPWLLFSFGSNSTMQMRARVENPNLASVPARVAGYTRCFGRRSLGWGSGGTPSGVATLAPSGPDTCTYGVAAWLTEEEKCRMDRFECANVAVPAYRLVEVPVTIHEEAQPRQGWAYIANPLASEPADSFTSTMNDRPSEPYLVAIHAMLTENYDMTNESITIRSVNAQGEVTVVDEWRHPGMAHLQCLESIVVEVNMRRENPWQMPSAITEVVGKLNDIGIFTVSSLCNALRPRADSTTGINTNLRNTDRKPFSPETLGIFRGLLL